MAAAASVDVYCTLLMSDSYLPGAMVLAHSLRDCGTKKKLAVLITMDSLLPTTISQLQSVFDYVIPVDKIANPNLENLARLDRLDLRFAFTKINLWRQTQFRRIVYIDADVVALRAPDELFDLQASFAAAPDVGWPDIFNTGVMMLCPNMSEYWSLQTLASTGSSFDGADQGLINMYYDGRPWHRLSFTYNCTPNASYQYEPAYRHFRSRISMVHFIGKTKPWSQGRQALDSSGPSVYKELLGRWWMVYDRHFRANTSSFMIAQSSPATVVSQYVRGEQPPSASSWALPNASFSPTLHGVPPAPPPSAVSASHQEPPPERPREGSIVTTDAPFVEASNRSENLQQPTYHEAPQEPSFAPPSMSWDATRSEPPAESKPEAANFPSMQYQMSQDPGLFQPPKSYPEPPKNMYYEPPPVPAPIEAKPKQIFPWEANKPKPTRVFADDIVTPTNNKLGSPSAPAPAPAPALPTVPIGASIEPTKRNAPTRSFVDHAVYTGGSSRPSGNPWTSFPRTNAWDDVTAIDRYVRAVKDSQSRRGKVQVLHDTAETDFASGETTPTGRRRESLILTDFPTEVERPSLPVTPAPQERRTFWGEERDESGHLPPAEGVPEQADWVCPRCGFVARSQSALRRVNPSAPKPVQSVLQPQPLSVRRAPGGVVSSRSSSRSSTPSKQQLAGVTTAPGLTSFTFHKNPLERLEELRRSSIVAEEQMQQAEASTEIPMREVPPTSASPAPAGTAQGAQQAQQIYSPPPTATTFTTSRLLNTEEYTPPSNEPAASVAPVRVEFSDPSYLIQPKESSELFKDSSARSTPPQPPRINTRNIVGPAGEHDIA